MMHTTLQECRTGCTPAIRRSITVQPTRSTSAFEALQAGIKQAFERVKSLGHYTPNLNSVSRMMLFLGAAGTAVQGYLFVPTVTDFRDSNSKSDAYLDRDY